MPRENKMNTSNNILLAYVLDRDLLLLALMKKTKTNYNEGEKSNWPMFYVCFLLQQKTRLCTEIQRRRQK